MNISFNDFLGQVEQNPRELIPKIKGDGVLRELFSRALEDQVWVGQHQGFVLDTFQDLRHDRTKKKLFYTLLKYLPVELRINFLQANKEGITPLHTAVGIKDLELVRLICKACGEEVKLKELLLKGDMSGTNPLHLAILNNSLPLCQAILDFCSNEQLASLFNPNAIERTPLFWASYNQNSEIAQALLQRCGGDSSLIKLLLIYKEGTIFEHMVQHNDDSTVETVLDACKKHKDLMELIFRPNEKGETPLFIAAENRNSYMVKLLLNSCGEDNHLKELLLKPNCRGETPLFIAKHQCNVDMIEAIVAATPKKSDLLQFFLRPYEGSDGVLLKDQTLLDIAIEQKAILLVQAILSTLDKSAREQFFTIDREGNTLLHRAAASFGPIVQALLDAYAEDPTLREQFFKPNQYGQTPLHIAANNPDVSVTQALLNGCSEDEKELLFRPDQNDRYPLLIAAPSKRGFHVLQLLLSAYGEQIDLNILFKPDDSGMTPLHYAALHKYAGAHPAKQILALAEKRPAIKALLFKKDNENNTPMHYAVREENYEIVPALLEACQGSEDLTMLLLNMDDVGNTPLHLAVAAAKHPSSVKALIQACGKKSTVLKLLFQPNKDGSTPLHLAVKNGSDTLVQALLDACGEDQSLKELLFKPDRLGRTPLLLASQDIEQNSSIIGILLAHAENNKNLKMLLFASDIKGVTPMHLAIAQRRYPIVQALIAACDGDKDLKKLLFKKGNMEQPLLYYPILNNDITIMQDLINACAGDKELRELLYDKGSSILDFAARKNKGELLEILVPAYPGDIAALIFNPVLDKFLISSPNIKNVIFEKLGGFDQIPFDRKLSLLPVFQPNQIYQIVHAIPQLEPLLQPALQLSQLIATHHLTTASAETIRAVLSEIKKDFKQIGCGFVSLSALSQVRPELILPLIPIFAPEELACTIPFLPEASLTALLDSKTFTEQATLIPFMTTQQKEHYLARFFLSGIPWDKAHWMDQIAAVKRGEQEREPLLTAFGIVSQKKMIELRQINTLKGLFQVHETEEFHASMERMFNAHQSQTLQEIEEVRQKLNTLPTEEEASDRYYDSLSGVLMTTPLKIPGQDGLWIDEETLLKLPRNREGHYQNPYNRKYYPRDQFVFDAALAQEIAAFNQNKHS